MIGVADSPESLVSEFSGLCWTLVWRYYTMWQNSPTLEKEDLHQVAMARLIQDRSELAGIRDQRQRGYIAWKIMSRGVRNTLGEANWGGRRAHNQFVAYQEYDVVASTPDFADEVDWYLTLESMLTPRTYRTLMLRLEGYTWDECGEKVGVSGMVAWNALRRELKKTGLAEELREGLFKDDPF